MNAQTELNQKLVAAYEALARGELQRADKLVSTLLQNHPTSRDAWHIQGLVQHKLGQLQNAAAALGRAISLNTNFVPPYAHFAQVLLDMGQLNEAVKVLQVALQMAPRSAEVLAAYARAESLAGRKYEAVRFYQESLEVDPNQLSVRGDLGVCLLELLRASEALKQFDLCLQLTPQNATVLSNRGNALGLLSRREEALEAYQAALVVDANFIDAHHNLGLLYLDMKEYEKAETCFRAALRVNPQFVEALRNLGQTLKLLDRKDEAIAILSLGTGYGQKSIPILMDRAALHQEMREYAAACADFEAVLAINPNVSEARGGLVSARMKMCDWQAFADTRAEICALLRRGQQATSPFEFKAIADDPELDQMCSALFGRQFVRRGSEYLRRPAPVPREKKIKLGYFSADYRNHPTAFLIRDVFRLHDRSRFEVNCLSFAPREDDMTASIRGACDNFFDIKEMNDVEAVEFARKLNLDIAIDLLGYTTYLRTQLFAERVAPVQINMMGFPGTMGVDFIDYLIGDRIVIPPENRKFISEKVIDMPVTYLASGHFHPEVKVAPIPTRSEVGLPEDAFIYCCFNNNYKITPEVFAAWMEILSAVDGSVLWLLFDTATTKANLRAEATARGIDPSRIIFAPRMSSEAHLARHACADLFLDAWPYNAHTTTFDALFMGLPVLTKMGKAFASRVAASMLHGHGLPELITNSVEAYQKEAIDLGLNKSKFKELKQKVEHLAKGQGVLDTLSYTRALEAAFEGTLV